MASPFEIASAVERTSDDSFQAQIPDQWQQGRGAFGGLVLGILTRAMRSTESDDARALRSLLGDLCGPVLPGPATIRVQRLRRGNNLSNLDAQLIQQGEVLARASAVFSSARKVDAAARCPDIPEQPAWQSVGVVPLAPPAAPVFTQHFEFRSTGQWPFARAAKASASGYVCEKGSPQRIDEAYIVALLDAWWPAQFAVEALPRPVATVSFSAQVLTDLARLDPTQPLFHRAEVVALQEGFFVEMRQLWSGTTLVALNQQTIALLK